MKHMYGDKCDSPKKVVSAGPPFPSQHVCWKQSWKCIEGNTKKNCDPFFSPYIMPGSFAAPWTVAHQAPLSMGFSRQESWSRLPFLRLGIFQAQGSNLGLLHCRWILYHWATGKLRSPMINAESIRKMSSFYISASLWSFKKFFCFKCFGVNHPIQGTTYEYIHMKTIVLITRVIIIM